MAAARELVVIGAPTSAASYAAGQEQAPRVLRDAGLVARLSSAGRRLRDAGDGPLQVWAPDHAAPQAQNVEAAVRAIEAVSQTAGAAFDADADVLVLGGNCTVALGLTDALIARFPSAGLLYMDRHFDANTPETTTDGALDWMGIAHALDVPGAVPELSAAFCRQPLLTAGQLSFLGVDESVATPSEVATATRLGLAAQSSTELAAEPAAATARALRRLPAAPLAVHLDVDVLDFTDAPLAESTGGRNTGPSLAAVAEALALACGDPRFRGLSIGELNPARSAGVTGAIDRFVAVIASALGR